jgi:DNA-directed RNA polymerase subunit RPC12/RpoP
MAEGRIYACSACAREIAAWSDGNPYFLDAEGAKHYAYHPDRDAERCTGNDVDVLCLACGAESRSDSAAPLARCPACDAAKLVDQWKLDGRRCPFCRAGRFTYDPRHFMIS